MISFMDQQPTTTLWGGRYLYFDVSHNSQFTSATVTLTLVTVKSDLEFVATVATGGRVKVLSAV